MFLIFGKAFKGIAVLHVERYEMGDKKGVRRDWDNLGTEIRYIEVWLCDMVKEIMVNGFKGSGERVMDWELIMNPRAARYWSKEASRVISMFVRQGKGNGEGRHSIVE